MKTRILYLCFVLSGLLFSCTPTSSISENSDYDAPPIYGTGGEHSREPDNEKD